jgi:3-oxoacyl-[acyl-carrier protein] reductase
MGSINNKVAFVTGGSRGIGQGIVRKLASEGADVAFTYHNSEDVANQLADDLSTNRRKSDRHKSGQRRC